MSNSRSHGCVRPDFFRHDHPEKLPEQARLLVLTQYADGELEGDSHTQVERHIQKCPACSRVLAELKEPEEIAVASCPSSESLDYYLFQRSKLSESHSQKIEDHLQQCPLCREEMEWLHKLEQPDTISSRAATRGPSMMPIMLMAAALAVAFTAFFFWKGSHPDVPSEHLRTLAVIKEPAQIDYAELEQAATPLDATTKQQYEKGVRLFKEAKFAEAGRLFEDVTKQSPGHSASLFLLGYTYYKLNQPEKAFALCDRAENIRPHAYERCMFLVHLALKTGHYDRALLEITALYHEVPEVPEIRKMYEQITALMPKKI